MLFLVLVVNGVVVKDSAVELKGLDYYCLLSSGKVV
jgi:hypothetical protein